jgi:hypothetical protein
LPGSQNFGQKAQNGPGKKVRRKNLWSNFGRIFPKVAENCLRKFSIKNVPFFPSMTNSQETDKILFELTLWLKAAFFCEIGRTFSKIGRTFLIYWPENNFWT